MKITFTPFVDDTGASAVSHPLNMLDVPELIPRPMSEVNPTWYKKLNFMSDHPAMAHEKTIKSCRPVHEYLQTGYCLPLWTDYIFERNSQTDDIIAQSKIAVAGHHPEQLGSTRPHEDASESFIVKFSNPWLINTPPGYSCLFMQPFYNFESRFTIMPAIVNTDLYYERIHFPATVSKNIKIPFTLPLGYPLIHIIPFKRENWKSGVSAMPEEIKGAVRKVVYLLRNTMGWTYHKLCGVNTSFK